MSTATRIEIGSVTAVPALNQLECEASSVKLEPKAMDVLVLLADRAGEVVSADELLTSVWKGMVVGQGSVYLAISQLRRALGELDRETPFIETIPKRGYRLTVPVRLVHSGPESFEAVDVAAPSRPAWPRSALPPHGKRAAVMAGGVALLTAVAIPWVLYETSEGGGLAAATPDAAAAPGSADEGCFEPPPPPSVQAQRLLMQVYNGQSLEQSLGWLDEALELGVHPAAVHAGKAFLYAQSLTVTVHAPTVDPNARARIAELVEEHAKLALQAEPRACFPYIALGIRDMVYWRWTDALESFRRADRDRKTPAFASYIFLSSYVDEHERAIALAEEVVRTTPDNAAFFMLLGYAQAYAGDYDAAVASLRLALSVAPQLDIVPAVLASAEIARGNHAAARAGLQTIPEPSRSYISFLLGVPSDGGLRALEARAARGEAIGTGDWAAAHLGAGEPEAALRWLEQAAEKARRHEPDDNFYGLMTLKMNVARDPVLERPEFAAVRRRIRGD